MIDIVPTILEVTGIKAPDEVNGIKQQPIEGVSMRLYNPKTEPPSILPAGEGTWKPPGIVMAK